MELVTPKCVCLFMLFVCLCCCLQVLSSVVDQDDYTGFAGAQVHSVCVCVCVYVYACTFMCISVHVHIWIMYLEFRLYIY